MISRLNILDIKQEDILNFAEYSVDWTKEPTESLKELCKQHAQYIRDNYDYVIVYYSGGSDSTTVLNSFLDNNIHIDEIITTVFEQIDIPCFDGVYAENYLKTKNFKGKYTNPKIALNEIKSFMYKDNSLLTVSNYTGTINSLSRLSVDNLEKLGFTMPVVRKGRIAHVYGYETPIVTKLGEHYYVNHTLSRQLLMEQCENTIKFFSSKDFPQLYVKQAHMLAKAMKLLNVANLTLPIINKLIRDTYNPLISLPKSGGANFIKSENKTEASLLYKAFSVDTSFKDIYLNAVLSQQYKIENTILHISSQTTKQDLLF